MEKLTPVLQQLQELRSSVQIIIRRLGAKEPEQCTQTSGSSERVISDHARVDVNGEQVAVNKCVKNVLLDVDLVHVSDDVSGDEEDVHTTVGLREKVPAEGGFHPSGNPNFPGFSEFLRQQSEKVPVFRDPGFYASENFRGELGNSFMSMLDYVGDFSIDTPSFSEVQPIPAAAAHVPAQVPVAVPVPVQVAIPVQVPSEVSVPVTVPFAMAQPAEAVSVEVYVPTDTAGNNDTTGVGTKLVPLANVVPNPTGKEDDEQEEEKEDEEIDDEEKDDEEKDDDGHLKKDKKDGDGGDGSTGGTAPVMDLNSGTGTPSDNQKPPPSEDKEQRDSADGQGSGEGNTKIVLALENKVLTVISKTNAPPNTRGRGRSSKPAKIPSSIRTRTQAFIQEPLNEVESSILKYVESCNPKTKTEYVILLY